MSVLHATLRRDWILHRRRLVDFALILLLAVTAFPGDQAMGFGIVGSWVAATLGARIGGDENLSGSLEFLWTRPVDRGEWFRMRFATGLVAVGIVFVVVVLADLVDRHRAFASLFVDVLDSDPKVAFDPASYLRPIGFVALVYTFAFAAGLTERRPEHVAMHWGTALASAAVVCGALVLGIEICRFSFASGGSGPLANSPDAPLARAAFAAVALAIVGVTALAARRKFATAEIAGGTVAKAPLHGWWLAVLILGGIAVLFLFWGVRAEAPR